MGRCSCSESAAAGCQCAFDDTNSIDVAGSGASGDPFSANVNIDPDADNLASITAQGLLVLDGPADIEMIGVTALTYIGSSPAVGTTDVWKMQSGQNTFTTDASGFITITFPTPFTGGLLTILVSNGDGTVHAVPLVWQSTVTLATFQVLWVDFAGNAHANQATRTCWLAIGWE